jgi:hypothetical protein
MPIVIEENSFIINIEEIDNELTVTGETQVTVVEDTAVTIVEVGIQGSPGASASDPTFPAASTLSGHRALKLNIDGKVEYASSDDLSDVRKVIGVGLNAATLDNPITVKGQGEIEESSWSWTPELPIYLGVAGALTQSPPSTGFVQILGTAISATKMFVNIEAPILLA